MATFLDAIGTLEEFSVIFLFILILVVVYGLLQYTKIFGENKAVYAIIALAIAVIFLFSQTASEIIKTMIPWFVVLFSALLFLLVGIKMFASKGADIDFWSMISEHSQISWWILAISLIIILGSIMNAYSKEGSVFSPEEAETRGEGSTGFWNAILHPKVLGLAVILFIASYTIRYMTKIS